MDPDLLLEMLSDPETAATLAQMGVFADKTKALGQERNLGESMYATPSAQGREVGRTYVASSPLEHIGVAVERTLGARKMNDAMGQQNALISGDANARQKLAAAMAAAMRRSRAAASPISTNIGPTPGDLDVAGAQYANEYGSGD